MIRKVLSQCALSLVNSWAGASLLASLEATDRRQNLLRVVTYHRVDRPEEYPHLYPGVHSATPEQFGVQLDELRNRFHIVSMQEVFDALENKQALPPRSVLITFDDAYQGFDDFAWPQIKQRDIPVTLFVPTAFPDHPERKFWWDRVHWAVASTKKNTFDLDGQETPIATLQERHAAARGIMALIKARPHQEAMQLVDSICEGLESDARQNEVLSWERLKELADEGVTMGAHTHTHPLMNRVTLDEAKQEATRSRDELQDRLKKPIEAFCYPAGGISQEVARMLESIGFKAAFTTDRGLNDLGTCDPMLLRRINVGGRTSPNVMRLQMLSYARQLN